MTSPGQTLIIHIQVEGAQQAAQQAQQAASGFDKFKKGLGKASKAATVAMAGIVAGAKLAADAASELEQSYGGLDSVFGDASKSVKQWAEDAATSVGLARDEYATAAAKMGAQFKNMGLATKPAAKATKQMIELGADLAATFGGSTQEAVDALSAALRGEADPAERYGLALNKTAINAEMAARGFDKLEGEARRAAEAQVLMDLATKQAGGAIGQFGREADTAAGAQQRANAAWRNATADLGQALLPIMQRVGTVISQVSKWVSQHSDLVLKLGGIVLGAAAAIKILNAVVSAGPWGRIIMLIGAMAAGIVALWQKSEGFRDVVTAVWNAVRSAAETAWNVIKTVVTTTINVITAVVKPFLPLVKGIWTGIQTAARIAWDLISGIVRAVVDVISGIVRTMKRVIVGVWETIAGPARTAWNIISGIVETVASAIGGFIQGAADVIAGIWDTVKATAATVWTAIKTVINAVVEPIKAAWNVLTAFFGGLFDGIAGIASAVWSVIQTVINAVLGPIKAAWNGITSFFSGLFSTIKSAASSAFSWIRDQASSAARFVRDSLSNTSTSLFDTKFGRLGGSWKLTASSPGPGGGAAAPVYYPDARITINVTGAGDPDATARAIESSLLARSRRAGGIVL